MNCKHCDSVMDFEGTQDSPAKNEKFDLYSCPNKYCSAYGHTISAEPVPFTPAEVEKYAPLMARLGKTKDYRAEVSGA